MVHGTSRDLTRAEESYVTQVSTQLRHRPASQRNRMVHSVRQVFLAGEPSDNYARIEREWGTPAQYAATLLARYARTATHPSPTAPQRRRLAMLSAVLVIAVAVIAVVVITVAIVLATR